MRRARAGFFSIAVAVFVIADASAQQTDREQLPVGSVKGHVICGDTQRPARFAEVILLRKPEPEPENKADARDERPAKVENQGETRVLLANGRSSLDGSYQIPDVQPGDYYVLAKMEGYIGPISTVETEDDTQDLDKVLAGVPTVHVVADRNSTADVTLRRGGTIKGTVRFDDGAPLGGGLVNVEPVDRVDASRSSYVLDKLWTERDEHTTDDEGNYRVSGLPPGKYRIRVDIQLAGGLRITQVGGPRSSQYGQSEGVSAATILRVYSSGTMRKSKTSIFEIKGDEQVSGADVKVDLNGLHSVRGKVLDPENQDGSMLGVAAVYDDNDKEFWRSTDFRSDGSFQIEYVPEGTYTLVVQSFILQRKEGVQFPRRAKLPVIVMDHDVDVNEVTLGGDAKR
jgi:hypothetical protein